MHQVRRALALLIQNYGLEVKSDSNGAMQLWWSLYTQGSGVCFDAELTDFRPVRDALFAEGQLDVAVSAKDLIDNHGLEITVRRTDQRYTHARTMDIETSGPTSERVDVAADALVVEDVRETVMDLVEKASREAESLLEDFYMIHVDTKEQVATYTSGKVRVEIVIEPTQPECLDWVLDGGDDADALEAMRYLAATRRDQAFGELKATVFVRVNSPHEEWREVCEETLTGVWRRSTELRNAGREVAHEAIVSARKMAESLTTNQLKEAA